MILSKIPADVFNIGGLETFEFDSLKSSEGVPQMEL